MPMIAMFKDIPSYSNSTNTLHQLSTSKYSLLMADGDSLDAFFMNYIFACNVQPAIQFICGYNFTLQKSRKGSPPGDAGTDTSVWTAGQSNSCVVFN